MTWPIVELGTVADTALGKMLDRGRSRGFPSVPYLRNVNVQWDRIDTTDLLEMELADDDRMRFEVGPGDLLVCEGGEIGRAAIWRRLDRIAYQKALHRVRSKGDLDLTFLRYVLEHRRNDGTLERLSTGSTIAHLPQQQLRRVPVPMPPLAEQRRIVEILEDHLSRLDAAQGYLSQASARSGAWFAGVVDQRLWARGYPIVPAAELLREPMRNGRSDRASSDGAGVRTLTLTAVTRNQFVDAHTKVTTTPESVAAPFWLEPGDVLVQRANTPELVGTAARFDGPRNWAIFPDLLLRLRPDESLLDGRLFVAGLRSERAHRSLRSRAKGLAGSMPKVDQKAVGTTAIPVPPQTEWEATITILESAERASASVASEADAMSVRNAALRRAVLAAAFEGKLTGRHTDGEVIEELASA